MDLSFILYIFFYIILLTGGFYSFYSSGQEMLAVIFFVGFLGGIIMFGLRWFSPTGTVRQDIGAWPPVVNYCPDYLTLHTINGTHFCIDTVGIAKAGGIGKWASNMNTADPRYTFNLSMDANMTPEQRIKALCDECKRTKVTWEGVYENGSCMNRHPPKPT
jgi:hypothetical protein